MVNRALTNSSPAHNVYLNQVAAAGETAASQYAFAGQLGASFGGKSAAELTALVFANLGVTNTTVNQASFTILEAAVTDYIAFHGTNNIGIIALQLGQLLANLEGDATFGAVATAWNKEVVSAYEYSINTSSSTPQTGESVIGQTNIVLTVGQDNLTGTANNDTFKANVAQNMLGQQVNTLGSGDILNGGAGFDTLEAKITNGSFVGSSNTASQPIQPETNSIEYIKLQAVLADATKANDVVYVNAKDMIGVKTISSNYSDASLVIQNLTTKGSTQLQDLTVNMSYTGNNDSSWDQSNFKVLFDQDYLTPQKTLSTASVDFLAMNEDNFDASKGANPLEGVFFRTLNFTLNGVEYNLAKYLGEDPAGKGDEIKTYADFLAAVQKGLVALKAENPTNAALQTVTASLGDKFTTDVNPVTLELRVGTSIRLTVEGQTDSKPNTLFVEPQDLEVARAGLATVPNNNRYETAGMTPPVVGAVLGINVELEKVGLAGDGGGLVIGSMNKGADANVYDAAKTVVGGTTNGINEFYVTVKGDNTKSNSLSELRSTNNQLKKVTVATDAAQTGTFANLTIGNSHSSLASGNQGALKDVKVFDASAFKGDLTLNAALTDEVVAKYLNLKDVSPAEAAADNAAFIYTGGTGNDTINLQVSSSNLAKFGTAAREDLSVNIVGGAGNDKITLSVVTNNSATLELATASNWYANQALNKNLRINAGDGDDIISKPGSGNVIIDAGAGNDTVYADNSAAKATFVFNATNALVDNLLSDANNSYNLYKTQVKVTFLGFEATAAIADKSGKATDLEINQAIKLAINNNATLKMLLVAEDGPANTLVVKSLVDGAMVLGDLAVSLVAPTAASITAGEAAQAAKWWGNAAVTDGASALTAINTQITNFGTKGDYLTKFGQTAPATDITGADSQHISDNTITGGLGDDILVLGTGENSNDTLVYVAGQFGNDKIVNFVAGAAPALPADPNGTDKLDFTSWLNNTTKGAAATDLEVRVATELKAAGAAVTLDANDVTIIDFNALAAYATGASVFAAGTNFGNLTNAQVLGALNSAGGFTVGTAATTLVGDVQKSLIFVQNNTATLPAVANLGEYKVYEVTSTKVAGENFTAATLVGSLDFGSAQAFDINNFVGGAVI